MDVLLALLVFGLAEIFSWMHRHLGDSIPHLEQRLNIKFTLGMVVLVLAGSTLLGRWTKTSMDGLYSRLCSSRCATVSRDFSRSKTRRRLKLADSTTGERTTYKTRLN